MIKISLREKIVILGLVLVYILIITKLFILTVIKLKPIKSPTEYSVTNNRVKIVDRNNVIIATDIDTTSLYLNRTLIENPNFVAENLSKILDLDYVNTLKKISGRNGNIVLIKRHLTPKEHLEIKKLGITSTIFENDSMRFYPQNNSFSHILGTTDIDKNGVFGIEKYYDNYLKNPENSPLKLTMDVSLQNILRTKLVEAKEKYKAKFLVGIITEIKTGNILASISIPDFNLNNINNADNNSMFNRITYGLYEMGSIFKIFTLASVFENKVAKKDTLINVGEPIRYGNFTIKDGNQVKKNVLTVEEVFTLSSNIGTVHLIKKVGSKVHLKFLELLGLLEKLDLDIIEKSLPIQPRLWKEINLYTISYGYGISVSPIHIVSATNTIINNGKFVSLRFSYEKKQTEKQIISRQTSNIMKDLFRKTVEKGTARMANVYGYEVGGKTGTAEHLSKKGGYLAEQQKSSFMGVFPISDPKYSIFILVDSAINPITGKAGTGGTTAAPIAGEIIEEIIPILNLQPNFK